MRHQLGFGPFSIGVPESIRVLRQGLPTGNNTSPLKEGPEACTVPPPTHTHAISPLVGLWQESMAQSWEETAVHMPGPAGRVGPTWETQWRRQPASLHYSLSVTQTFRNVPQGSTPCQHLTVL